MSGVESDRGSTVVDIFVSVADCFVDSEATEVLFPSLDSAMNSLRICNVYNSAKHGIQSGIVRTDCVSRVSSASPDFSNC
jgi:hypothetical protein